MKKEVAAIFIACFACFNVYSQDTITTKTGDYIKANVMEIGPTEIKYKRFEYQNWPTHIIQKSDVLMIRYENGTKDTFTQAEPVDSSKALQSTMNSSMDNCSKGKMDAHLYHGRESGNLFLGFMFGPFGVIGAALSNPKPKKMALAMSKNKDLFNDPNYLSCYKKKSREMNIFNSSMGWASWILLLLLFHT